MLARSTLTKVPEITLFFWIIKILTTAAGESTSDYLVAHIDPILAVALGGIGLFIALLLQFSTRRYVPWIYWLAVVMVAIFGTMAADVLHIGLGIPYVASSIFFALALIIIFILWYVSEQTLSIHSIHTTRREVFYWATVMATFALGTAAGDMTATTLGLGYLSSGIVFGALIVLVTIAHYITKSILALEDRHQSRNAVLAFWFAYILTRPLGASFADWTGRGHSVGGLGLGNGLVSVLLLIIIICLVTYITLNEKTIGRNFYIKK